MANEGNRDSIILDGLEALKLVRLSPWGFVCMKLTLLGGPPNVAPQSNCLDLCAQWTTDHPVGMLWSQFSHRAEFCWIPGVCRLFDCPVFRLDHHRYGDWRSQD